MGTKIILDTDPEAAAYQTGIEGWISREGRFHGFGEGAERLARYDGCTHKKCGCGEIYEKHAYCRPCNKRNRQAKFDALEVRPWKGEPLMVWDDDTFFFDGNVLGEYIFDNDIAPSALELVLCTASVATPIDFDDLFVDQLPEDTDLADISKELGEKCAEFNAFLAKNRFVLGYEPTNYKVQLVFDADGYPINQGEEL